MNAIQQGQADGLCGIYSIINFLRDLPEYEGDNDNDIMRYLLEGAAERNWLNPYTITDGFYDHQLKCLVDDQIEKWRLPWQTVFLQDVRAKGARTIFDLVNRIFEQGGVAILNVRRKDHWVLLRSVNESGVLFDSADDEPSGKLFVRGNKSFSPNYGFVILPAARPVKRIDL